jgi:hypothetical protein
MAASEPVPDMARARNPNAARPPRRLTRLLPTQVKTFVVYFYRHIREKNGARAPAARRRAQRAAQR